MTPRFFSKLLFLFVVLFVAEGCGSLAPPFDKMTKSPMTIYRLQNFEQAAPAPAAALPMPAGIPQLPQLAQMGNDFLKQLGLPPLLPGATATNPAAPQQDFRFPTAPPPGYPSYRILQYRQVTDPQTQSDIATLFGTESNFTTTSDNCMYPELGFAIQNPAGGTAEIIVSAGCKQVRGFNFQWPYKEYGIADSTLKKLGEIVTKVFAGA